MTRRFNCAETYWLPKDSKMPKKRNLPYLHLRKKSRRLLRPRTRDKRRRRRKILLTHQAPQNKWSMQDFQRLELCIMDTKSPSPGETDRRRRWRRRVFSTSMTLLLITRESLLKVEMELENKEARRRIGRLSFKVKVVKEKHLSSLRQQSRQISKNPRLIRIRLVRKNLTVRLKRDPSSLRVKPLQNPQVTLWPWPRERIGRRIRRPRKRNERGNLPVKTR